MPNSDTFQIPPIAEFVTRWLREGEFSVDPFARNNEWATYTNDLNPNTKASSHIDAQVFLETLPKGHCDIGILDPPYSPRQISECYQEAGIPCGMKETQNAALYSRIKKAMLPVLTDNAVVLSFGWNSVGMGRELGFEIVEIMLVCHGGAHNDTICMAERRVQPMLGL